MFSNIKAARLLGWTSLAIGLTELVATRLVEDEIGVDNHRTLIRSFGIREIAAGAMILAQPGLNRTLANGLWARVAGDAVDLAALGEAATVTENPTGLARSSAIVAAITGIDLLVAFRVQRDLNKARQVAESARQRVHKVNALPRGTQSMPSAQPVTESESQRSVLEVAGR